jgi:tetratricopeptide (TPR) repeat protein
MTRHDLQQRLGAGPTRGVAIRSVALAWPPCLLVLSGCLHLGGFGRSNDDPTRSDDVATLRRQSALACGEAFWPHRVSMLQLAQAQLDSALLYNAEALRREPDFAPALSLRSRLFYQLQRHQEAVDLLRAADARQPLSGALLAGLALHLERLQAYDEADQVYSRLQPAPETDGVLLYRQLSGNEFEPALKFAQQAVTRNPKHAQTRNNFGVALLYAGKPDEAKAQLLQAHELDARLPGPLYNLAIVDRFYFFDAEASRQWLNEYLQLSTEDPDGLVESFAQMDAVQKPKGAK